MTALTIREKMDIRSKLREAGVSTRGMTDDQLREAVAELGEQPAPQETTQAAQQATDNNAMANFQAALQQLMNAQQAQPRFDESHLVELIKKHATVTHTVQYVPKPTGEVKKIGNAHPELAYILDCATVRNVDGTRMNNYLYGPAGSGKTTIGLQVSIALDLEFYSMGAIHTPYELVGSINAHGKYNETAFYKAFKHGGVFLQDEIDSCSPRALLVINQALANDRFTFPNNETVMRHEDFVYIAGANTIGKGATLEYVGRAQLDAATIDRFFQTPIEYIDEVEHTIAINTASVNGMDVKDAKQLAAILEVLEAVKSTRDKVAKLGIKAVISPRATARSVALLAKGYKLEQIKERVILAGLSQDQKERLK